MELNFGAAEQPSQPSAEDLLVGLNPAQRGAVETTEGPVLIIAGAGSGKTRVLTYRLAYILRQRKADPFQILALTFTNKAAREMKERIGHLIGPDARALQMGTFHSIFSRILRAEAQQLGYTSAFTIYDDEDQQSLVRTILKELKLDEKHYKPRNVQNRISHAKNYLISAQQYLDKYVADDWSEVTAKIYAIYQQRLLQSNAMDFDDLLYNMVLLFEKYPAALHKYQHRFKYIMVDEYQDTNHAQYVITRKLAAVHENICVVGDDAQSIYSFRGADITNILSFQKDYPDAKTYKLEENYRSTGVIVSAANEIIANNKNQLPKTVFTNNEEGELIRVLQGGTEQEEAARVVDVIREQRMMNQLRNKDFAVLYRTNAQSRAIEDGLRRAGIVYKVFGGLSFYKRKEIKDVVAYLRLAINPHDEEALKRVINYPIRGIGDVTVAKLVAASQEHKVSMWEALQQAEALGLGRSAKLLEEFAVLVKTFQAMAERDTAHEVVAYVAKHSGILKELHQDNTTEGLSRWENVQELINAAREYSDLPELADKRLHGFLAEVALFTDADQKIENDDFVTLMTIHSAKGLEFKSVFVVGLEENLFPGTMAAQSRQDLEEERRLFYVAVTRAQKYLTLTHARSRFKYGSIAYNEPSRFLAEVNERYLKLSPTQAKEALRGTPLPNRHPASPYNIDRMKPLGNSGSGAGGAGGTSSRAAQVPPSLGASGAVEFAGDDLSNLQEGQQVEHGKFGVGTVVRLEQPGGDARAVINFKVGGNKTLILKYAKLKILS